MARRSYAGGAVPTTLSSPITTSSTTASLTSAAGWPDTSVGPFAVVMDRGLATEEKALVSNRSGTAITFSARGYDGTTTQNHSSGATIEHISTAVDHDESNAHVNSASGVHGLDPGDAVVGRASPQAISNKDITDSTGDFTTLRHDGDDVATVNATQTLANKTLVSPTISGTATIENANVGGAPVVTTSATQSLMNKTLGSPILTTPNIVGGDVNANTLKRNGVDAATVSDIQTLSNKTVQTPVVRGGISFVNNASSSVGSLSEAGVLSLPAQYSLCYYAIQGIMGESDWIRMGVTAVEDDPFGWFDDPTAAIKVPYAGVYRLSGAISFSAGANGRQRSVQWGRNGTRSGKLNSQSSWGTTTVQLPTCLRRLNAGDTVNSYCYYTDDTLLTTVPGTAYTWINVEFVGT